MGALQVLISNNFANTGPILKILSALKSE